MPCLHHDNARLPAVDHFTEIVEHWKIVNYLSMLSLFDVYCKKVNEIRGEVEL